MSAGGYIHRRIMQSLTKRTDKETYAQVHDHNCLWWKFDAESDTAAEFSEIPPLISDIRIISLVERPSARQTWITFLIGIIVKNPVVAVSD